MKKCPVPGCDYTFDILTTVHTRAAHQMEPKEVVAKYGKPQELTIPFSARRWAAQQSPVLSEGSFISVFDLGDGKRSRKA